MLYNVYNVDFMISVFYCILLCCSLRQEKFVKDYIISCRNGTSKIHQHSTTYDSNAGSILKKSPANATHSGHNGHNTHAAHTNHSAHTAHVTHSVQFAHSTSDHPVHARNGHNTSPMQIVKETHAKDPLRNQMVLSKKNNYDNSKHGIAVSNY